MGSHFARLLHNRYPNYRIVNLDILSYAGNSMNLADIAGSQRYAFVRGDICDRDLLDKLFREYAFDAVVNFAAESHVDRSIVSALHFVRTNIQGVHALLEAVRVHKVPRFIQISTDEIYGDVRDGVSHEESPMRPSNPYAASKASADLLVQAFMRTHRVPAIIVRGSNNFGPFQHPEKLTPLAVTSFLEGANIPVHGNGMHVRRWVYVKDFSAALDAVMHASKLHEIYNVAGAPKTNREIIEAVARILGKNPVRHMEYIPDRPGADLRYAPDSTKIERELGWRPAYDFDAAFKETVAWYQANEPWWRALKESEEFKLHYEKQSKAQYY